MPPGRTPIVTRRVSDDRAEEVWKFVRKQVESKHQAYVVYPVIEENEETELKAAMKMFKELSKKVFPDLRVGLLHGRLPADLKEYTMQLFQKGEIDILVATTVIEVGVDVAAESVACLLDDEHPVATRTANTLAVAIAARAFIVTPPACPADPRPPRGSGLRAARSGKLTR